MQQLTARSWRKLRSALQPLPPRAPNAYATHVPVLIGLAAMRRVERVLEFGCGHYSTKTFLEHSVFPDLKELQSVENDRTWADTMRAAVKDDPRCLVKVVSGAMCDAVSNFDLERFDLILVDDSTNAEARAATIRALSNRHPLHPWIVIHDYEVEEYRRASSGFKQRFTFKTYNPHTGLISNSGFTNTVKALDQRLKHNSSRLRPDDAESWLRILRTLCTNSP
jgi:hypothetical protein